MKIPITIDIQTVPFPLAESLQAAPERPESASSGYEEAFSQTVYKLAQLADHHWRIGTLVLDDEADGAKEKLEGADLRKIARSLEAMAEIFESTGLTVFDRTGQDFNHGLPETVITEEAREGISRERVIRTIRPTILWNQQMVQRGEIDIAVPMPSKPAVVESTPQKEVLPAGEVADAPANSPEAAPESTESQSPTL